MSIKHVRQMKIAYYPENTGTNDYSNRFKDILSNFGEVKGVSFRRVLKDLFRFKITRSDVIFINWLDSGIINDEGQVKRTLLIKSILKVLLFKVLAKKLLYVRHNLYPHGTQGKDAKKAKAYTELLVKLSGKGIVHSPVEVNEKLFYVPHPLYKSDADFMQTNRQQSAKDDNFIFFGRINKYKKLEELIKVFPKDKKLVIAGSYDDENYVTELKLLASENVTIRAGYIDNAVAEELISNSQGLIICHADPDMIVSGSFFYALSMKTRVICVETRFLRWASDYFGDSVVTCYQSIEEMGDNLSDISPSKVFDDSILDSIKNNFGEITVAEKIKHLF